MSLCADAAATNIVFRSVTATSVEIDETSQLVEPLLGRFDPERALLGPQP